MKKRCSWVNLNNKKYIEYHDSEWGVPVHDDRLLFEMLILEGMQAGLSRETVLNKRKNYKNLFYNFDIRKCASLTSEYLDKTLLNPGIIRHRSKIYAIRNNAVVFQKIQYEFGSFCKYIWGFTNNKVIVNNIVSSKDVQTKSVLSEQISTALKKKGMKFVGPTIIYAYMQAIGIINDHENSCFCKNLHYEKYQSRNTGTLTYNSEMKSNDL